MDTPLIRSHTQSLNDFQCDDHLHSRSSFGVQNTKVSGVSKVIVSPDGSLSRHDPRQTGSTTVVGTRKETRVNGTSLFFLRIYNLNDY